TEGIISHDDVAHTGEFHYPIKMFVQLLRTEERARFGEITCPGIEAKCLENANDAAGSFRQRCVGDKHRLPDQISPLGLVQVPERGMRQISGTEELGDQVVIIEQVVNAV